ncbi:MAG TPA: ATP-binding protein [Myxococcus sp.]|nr:ATP-binding protein [Myxococcus sp.]
MTAPLLAPHPRFPAASVPRRTPWEPHGLALLCAGAAAGLGGLLAPWLALSPFLLPIAGVLLAARFGGRRAGVLAAAVSAALAHVLFSGGPHLDRAPATLLFLAVGGLAATFAGRTAPVASRAPGAPSEARLEAAVLRSTRDAVLATDSEGVIRFLNPAAAELLRWTEAEALGVHVSQVLRLIREDTRGPVADPLSRLLGGAPEAEVRREPPLVLLRRGGSELPIEASAVLLSGLPDAARGAVLVLRDATAQRQLERERAELLTREHAALREVQAQRERMESLILQAPVAISVFRGPDHVCELLNPRARELFHSGGAPTGRPLRELLPDLDAGLLLLLDDVYRGGVPFSGREVPLSLKPLPGTAPHSVDTRYFDLSWQPWRDADGAILGVVVVAVEVTGLVCARRSAEALAEELREALQTRDEFLSIASHELKTPLTSVQLQLQMLLRSVPPDAPGGLSTLVRQRAEASLRPVTRLHQLVMTLMDVSRIRAGRLQLQEEVVDLTTLTQELVTRLQEDAALARCPVRLDAEDGPLAGRWDRLRLEQVLTNLLSNAFKYGAQRPVEVRVARDGGFARLTVRDHGIGIAPEDHERIFQRFERAVSERHYGGFGLGLWIVRQIVDSLHGDIRVESQPGQGATFIVRLPLDEVRAAVA